ncbi:hypothetical protein J6V86_01690 [bacterium]|nr:hypothetical protein [bacterium]
MVYVYLHKTYANLIDTSATYLGQRINKALYFKQKFIYLYQITIMITTQGDREMHSNISIDLSRKNNSKSPYSNQRTYSHSTRNTSSQTLYAQAVN